MGSKEFASPFVGCAALASVLALGACGGTSGSGGGSQGSNPANPSGCSTCDDFTGRWRLSLAPRDTTCTQLPDPEVDTVTMTQSGCQVTGKGSTGTYACSACGSNLDCTATGFQDSGTVTMSIITARSADTLTGSATWQWTGTPPSTYAPCSGDTSVAGTRLDTPTFTWRSETLPFTASNLQVAVHDPAHVQVVYVGSPSLEYADSANGWAAEKVAESTNGFALAIDAAGTPWVVNGGSGGVFLSGRGATTGWAATRISTDNPSGSGMALDAAGASHVVYCTMPGALVYATNASGAWVTTPTNLSCLDSSPDLHVALDSTGAVHFVFVDYNTGVNYATNSGGTWHSQQLESWSGTSGLVVDAEDHVSVVCSGEGLDYWTNSTGTWQKTAISGNCGVVRLAMDTHGRLVLACDDSTPTVNAPAGASLMLGYLGNAGWDLQSVWSVPTPGGVSSADVDLAIDTQDNIHIIWGFYNAPALYVTSAP